MVCNRTFLTALAVACAPLAQLALAASAPLAGPAPSIYSLESMKAQVRSMGMTRSRRAAATTTADQASTETASDAPEPVADIDQDVQEMFVVALMANSPYGMRGTREELTAAGTKEIKQVISLANTFSGKNTELVWGPAYKMTGEINVDTDPMPGNFFLYGAIEDDLKANKGRNATYINAMYVARDKDTNTYYVGISGTNAVSTTCWLLEDFWVDEYVNWAYSNNTGKAAGPKLFAGVNLGLSFLQTIKPAKGAPGAGKTVAEYLLANVNKNSTVRVAGISLGGALTTPFALWLHEAGLGKLKAAVNVTANPFAGFSPGNKAFAKHYGSSPLAQYTYTLNNDLDIVPHVWDRKTLAQLPTLYESQFPGTTACIKPIMGLLTSLLGDSADAALVNPQNTPVFTVGYAPADALADAGNVLGGNTLLAAAPLVYGADWDKCKAPLMQWFGEAGWQHTTAYVQYLGLSALVAATKAEE